MKTVLGATAVVLLLRLCLGIIILPASVAHPFIPIERSIGLWPEQAVLADWLQRLFIAPWVRWDAVYFWHIVDHGYVESKGTPAFHPLYPLIAWVILIVTGKNTLLSLNIVSTLATIIFILLFTRYVARFHDPTYSQLSGWFILLNPIGFILMAPYTESTFMCFAIGTLWALRLERWWLAGILGAFASLTRQQGLALVLPMLWAIWVAWPAKAHLIVADSCTRFNT